MDFQQLADVAEKWCSNTPFELIATEETERRMDFYADPGVSFYVLCPDNGCGDNFHVWSESEDCLPFLQLAQDYISSCGKKTLHEVLEKVFKSFRPLLGLPDTDDDAFEEYSADVEEEGPEADHPQMGACRRKPDSLSLFRLIDWCSEEHVCSWFEQCTAVPSHRVK
uniref:Maturin n=1 Tax=Equus caballus TaxID=9796 RepID=A0A3Q2HWX8_HORSE